MNPEEWRDIPGVHGRYQVSNHGRVMSHRGGRILKPWAHPRSGHLQIKVGEPGSRVTRYIHHLVLLAFVGPRPDGAVGRHLDDNPLNNTPENLAWGTHGQNRSDASYNAKVRAERNRALSEQVWDECESAILKHIERNGTSTMLWPQNPYRIYPEAGDES